MFRPAAVSPVCSSKLEQREETASTLAESFANQAKKYVCNIQNESGVTRGRYYPNLDNREINPLGRIGDEDALKGRHLYRWPGQCIYSQ